MLDYILLGILNYEPMTGYDIKQFIDSSTAHFWYAQTSQIYRTLDKLEAKNLLNSDIEQQDNRPNRRVYHITGQGRKTLQNWLLEPQDRIPKAKNELLVFLFFAGQLDKEALLKQLRHQREILLQQATLENAATYIKQTMAEHPEFARDARLWEATRRFGEITQQAYKTWLDETITMIEDEF